MKTLWTKTPAWIKVLLISTFIFYPVIFLNQIVASINTQVGSNWGWGILFMVPVVIVFWFVAKRLTNFTNEEDVKISMKIDAANPQTWMRIFGLMILTVTSILFFIELLGSAPSKQLALLQYYKQFDVAVAVPLLIGIAFTAGVIEEVVYRSILQNILVRSYPKIASFIGIALLFTIMHFLPISMVVAYLMISFFFSLVADEFKSLGAVVLAHFFVDVFLLLGFYFGATDFQNIGMLVPSTGIVIALFLLLYKNKAFATLTSFKKKVVTIS